MATAFLENLSTESLEILEHFGADAPKTLNDYACRVEDALLEQIQLNKDLLRQIEQLQSELDRRPLTHGSLN
jgi:hypothetical protein